MSGLQSKLALSEATKLLEGEEIQSPSSRIPLNTKNKLYKMIYEIVQERMIHCPHSFQMKAIDTLSTTEVRSRCFRSELKLKADKINFLFHGTKEENHQSIINQGFLLDEEHFGDTDAGFIGKGVYLSPHPEYCAAYIKDTAGISRFSYSEPVAVNIDVKILGCIVIIGRSKQMFQKELDTTIGSGFESHWAWVRKNGNVTAVASECFAQEFAIKDPIHIYPRFAISLTRVIKEVIWVDPNIENTENSSYVAELSKVSGVNLFATSDSIKGLDALKKKKEGVEYRAVTAGRGGESFVQSLRLAGVQCKVMVFCGAVSYHKQWAKKFGSVEVTSSAATFKNFASWK